MHRRLTRSDGATTESPARSLPGVDSADITASAGVHGGWKVLPDEWGRGPAMVAVVSGPGHIIEFSNTAFDRAVPQPPGPQGGSGRSLAGSRASGAVPGWEKVTRMMDEVRSTGELGANQEVSVLVRSPFDGTALVPAYFSALCMPLAGDAGAPTLLFVAVDVTERVREQLDDERGRTRLAESERHHRDISLTLQRSLLAPENPVADGLDVAARYLAGTSGTEVGGDWYDVINLGAGRVAVVIGDVMGRGVRAAALMGQLRAAIRSYAHLDLPPAEVLRLLGSLMAELDAGIDDQNPPKIATCLYGVYDPTDEELGFASAGHPPPVVVDPAGRRYVVDHEPDPPLGIDHVVAREKGVSMPAGSLLALYTDGLVEQRDRDIDVGIAALRDALRDGGDLEGAADRVLAELRPPGGYDDDAALLLVHVPLTEPAGRPRHSRLLLGGSHQSVRHVRHHVRRVLRRWGVPAETVDAAVLVADEIATNAIVHGEPPIRFVLRSMPHRVVVEVADGNPQLPRQRHIAIDAEQGRGLHIVAAATSRWGSRATTAGKVVWAEIPFPENYPDYTRAG